MKRLLPLLAALALPTAVNAESLYLSCDILSTKYSDRDGLVWDWSPVEVGVGAPDFEIRLDNSNDKGYLLDKRFKANEINRLNEAYISPSTIVVKYKKIMMKTEKTILYSTHSYEIDRNSSRIYGLTREYSEPIGKNTFTLLGTMQRKGICKKISNKDSKI